MCARRLCSHLMRGFHYPDVAGKHMSALNSFDVAVLACL